MLWRFFPSDAIVFCCCNFEPARFIALFSMRIVFMFCTSERRNDHMATFSRMKKINYIFFLCICFIWRLILPGLSDCTDEAQIFQIKGERQDEQWKVSHKHTTMRHVPFYSQTHTPISVAWASFSQTSRFYEAEQVLWISVFRFCFTVNAVHFSSFFKHQKAFDYWKPPQIWYFFCGKKIMFLLFSFPLIFT